MPPIAASGITEKSDARRLHRPFIQLHVTRIAASPESDFLSAVRDARSAHFFSFGQ